MKLFIIGGAGYIGSHVVRAFLDRGDKVTVYDNFSSGCKENIFKECTVIEDDILNYKSLVASLKDGYDAIVHLAAFKAAGESMIKPEKYSVNNITGTINILNACCESNVNRIIFSSSAAVYGEPKYLPIDEKHPTNPENYYGFTKLAIESFLNWYDKLKGLKFAALRYFNAAGYDVNGRIKGLEKNPANLLPVIMEVATGKRSKLEIFGNDYPTRDGTGVRDYIHVSDLAMAHVLSFDYLLKKKKSVLVNLGSENGISVKEMLDIARTISGKKIPSVMVDRRPGDPAKLYASAKLAKKLLNWKAKYSDISTLVKSTWNIYQK